MTILTQKSFKEAVENSRGTKTQIAEYLGLTFQAVWNYCQKYPEFTEQLLLMARKRNVSRSADIVYSTTQIEITDNNGEIIPALVNSRLKAAELVLKTQGKDEGWVEKQQIEHSGDQSVNINLIEQDIQTIKNGKLNNKPETNGDTESTRG